MRGDTKAVWAMALVGLAALAVGCSRGETAAAPAYSGDAATDLVEAVRGGDKATVTRLMDETPGALELRDREGRTLLHYATLSNRPEMVALLVERGMDPNVRDAYGMTPLAALEDSNLRAEEARKAIVKAGGTS